MLKTLTSLKRAERMVSIERRLPRRTTSIKDPEHQALVNRWPVQSRSDLGRVYRSYEAGLSSRTMRSLSILQRYIAAYARQGLHASERSHRHVLRCPFSNSRNFTESVQERVGVHDSLKADSALTNSASKRANSFGSCCGQTDICKFGVSKNLRHWEKMSEANRGGVRSPERFRYPLCKRCPTFYGNLLAQDRTDCELETIPTMPEYQANSLVGNAYRGENPLRPLPHLHSNRRCFPCTYAPDKSDDIDLGTNHGDKEPAVKSRITR